MADLSLRGYIRQLEKINSNDIASEHTYRPVFQHFVQTTIGPNFQVINEPLKEKSNAPDFAIVDAQGVKVGYIECKSYGHNLDIAEKSEQLKRYRENFPNLILTNYVEFRYYDEGILRLMASVNENTKRLETIFSIFCSYATMIDNPTDLSGKMAKLASELKVSIIKTLNSDPDGRLSQLLKSYREILIPDLSPTDYADMQAQTITYGLFITRCLNQENSKISHLQLSSQSPSPFIKEALHFINESIDDEDVSWLIRKIKELFHSVDIPQFIELFKSEGKRHPIVHFYEDFLEAYDKELRKSRGVYFTPKPAVSFIVKSVNTLLQQKFDLQDGLAHNDNNQPLVILDPAVGTGTFLLEVISNIRESVISKFGDGAWPIYVVENLIPRIFGFELQMAPYAVCHLNLALSLDTGNLPKSKKVQFGVYLTNTLQRPDPVGNDSGSPFAFHMYKEAEAADKVKLEDPVMVVLGNPPYSGHSANNNNWIRSLLRGRDLSDPNEGTTSSYFHLGGAKIQEANLKWLNDDYVKFIRFAQWRIEQTGKGVIGFITNHSWMDNPTFRGMRASILGDFDEIYLLNLHGNANKGLKQWKGEIDENIFDIKQGVAILLLVKLEEPKNTLAKVWYAEMRGTRQQKYQWLEENCIHTVTWKELKMVDPSYYFVPINYKMEQVYKCGWNIKNIFRISSTGVVTSKDELVIAQTHGELKATVQDITELPESSVKEKYGIHKESNEWNIKNAKSDLLENMDPNKFIKPIRYRPFDTKVTWYTGKSKGFMCRPRRAVMKNMLNGGNIGLIICRQQSQFDEWAHCSVTSDIVEACALSGKTKEICHLFPLFEISSSDDLIGFKNDRRHNLDSQFVNLFIKNIGLKFDSEFDDLDGDRFGPMSIFFYIFAVLSSPSYRSRYSEFLRRDFPHVPIPTSYILFKKLHDFGKNLSRCHNDGIESVPAITKFEVIDEKKSSKELNCVELVKYEALGNEDKGRVWISQRMNVDTDNIISGRFFNSVPAKVWNYKIGSYRPAEKWLKDRVGQSLGFSDIEKYARICGLISLSIRNMELIDETIKEHGGWDDAFYTGNSCKSDVLS